MVQDFESDGAIEGLLDGEIHGRHAARADQALDAIARDVGIDDATAGAEREAHIVVVLFAGHTH